MRPTQEAVIAFLTLALGGVVLVTSSPGLAAGLSGMKPSTAWTGIAVIAAITIGLLAFIVLRFASELKRARDALREARARMSTALVSLSVGVWEIDVSTRRVVWAGVAAGVIAGRHSYR